MGDPKKPRKKYSTPRNPWSSDQLAQELYLVGTYGLRNKRELWKAQTELSRLRKEARSLLAAAADVRARRERNFLEYLGRRGLIDTSASVDDVLELIVENVLDRRLQTVVWKKGLSPTLHTARQMVTHRHIKIGDRVTTIPSYWVSADEEEKVKIKEDSRLIKQLAAESSNQEAE